MAPAIVHFLVGASLLLLLSAPLALRFARARNAALLFVTAGGIWGLVPDVHHVLPVYRQQIYALHGSPWADAFAFHYTLDLEPVRGLMFVSILAAVLLFCLSAVVFTAVCRVGVRHGTDPVTVDAGTKSGVLAGILVATPILGTAVHASGYLDAIGALAGRGLLFGWLLVAGCTTVAAVAFALLVELGSGAEPLSPGRAAVFGLVLGVLAWFVAVVLVLPVFLVRLFGTAISLGHVDAASFVGFALAGGALGVTYTAVVRRAGGRSGRRSDRSGLQQ